MSSWTLESIPPHDWFLCLDIDQYFDHEHDPEKVFEEGFTRPIPVGDRDVMVTSFFNGDPDNPEFHFESPEALSKDEIEKANKSLSRIFGTNLDLRPLYDQAADDPVLGPKLTDYYGFKRMARPTFSKILSTALLRCDCRTNLQLRKWSTTCAKTMAHWLLTMVKAFPPGHVPIS